MLHSIGQSGLKPVISTRIYRQRYRERSLHLVRICNVGPTGHYSCPNGPSMLIKVLFSGVRAVYVLCIPRSMQTWLNQVRFLYRSHCSARFPEIAQKHRNQPAQIAQSFVSRLERPASHQVLTCTILRALVFLG